MTSRLRGPFYPAVYASVAAAFACATLLCNAAESGSRAPQDGKIAYALVSLHWATYQSADGKTECPHGFNEGPREQFKKLFPDDGTVRSLSETELKREIEGWFPTPAPDGLDFKEATGSTALGMNLDGTNDAADFESPDGQQGIDNQLYRALGCINSYRGPQGANDFFDNEEIGKDDYNRLILEVSGIETLADSKNVTVTIYRGRDPLLADAGGTSYLPGGTQRIDLRWGWRFIQRFHGKIEGGVLITEPGDLAFPWATFELHALVGGEGMTEELRDLLLQRFRSVFSGYGATDIEIGMAGESPVSVAVRRLARARPDIQQALFGDDSRLPMVFQYNPLIHFLEVNAEHEIVCTVSRLDLLAPRIRYNVHDEGGLIDFQAAASVLRRFGIDINDLGTLKETAGPHGPLPWAAPIPLPFLWVYGRRDATISVMGANIYPEDIESVVYRDAELVPRLHSFLLSVVDDASGTPRPMVALELTDEDDVDDAWRARMSDRLRDGLRDLNIDYRSSILEFPAAMQPIVQTYGLHGGPFAADASRIKQRRVIKS